MGCSGSRTLVHTAQVENAWKLAVEHLVAEGALMPLRNRPIDVFDQPRIGDQPPGLSINYRTLGEVFFTERVSEPAREEAERPWPGIFKELLRETLLDRLRGWVVELWRRLKEWLVQIA